MSKYHESDEAPVHYLKDIDKSVQWLPCSHNVDTVLEYNIWDGNPGLDEAVERTRRVVLMQTDHDAILRINCLLNKGDPAALKALMACESLGRLQAVLGYDFKRSLPTVMLYFDNDEIEKA